MTRQSTSVVVLAVACAWAGAAAAQPRDTPPFPPADTVVTTGEHVSRVAPDMAVVTVVAEARAKVPREAQRANAATMTAVQQRLKALGIADAAMQTRSVDLQPEHDYTDGRQVLRGYVARNVLEVRVDGVDRVTEIVDAAVGAGASRVEGLRFELKDRDRLQREALTKAVEDGLARAAAMAKGAGRSLGAVLRIDDGRAPIAPEPRVMLGARMAMAEAAMPAPPETPVQAGEIEVSARVTVVVRLQ